MPFHIHNYPSLKYEHDKPRITLISLRIAKYLTFSKPVNTPLLLLDTYTQKHFRFISCQTFQQINIFISAKPKGFYLHKREKLYSCTRRTKRIIVTWHKEQREIHVCLEICSTVYSFEGANF